MIETYIIDASGQEKPFFFQWACPNVVGAIEQKSEDAILLVPFDNQIDTKEPHTWLAPDQSLAALEQQLKPKVGQFKTIALWIPKFTDGRAYSLAFFIRHRLGYLNNLLAIGDIQIDQLVFLQRVGFDLFALKQPIKSGLNKPYFSDFYQSSLDTSQNVFEKRLVKKREVV
jgi:uncharacterized protein (DUF934 family)